MERKRTLRKEEQFVREWNADHPIGTPIRFWPLSRGEDPVYHGRTRSEAWLLGGHSAVVLTTNYSGAVALSHVEVITEEQLGAVEEKVPY